MQKKIHPELHKVTVHCTGCGSDFQTRSTIDDIRISLCSQCHPYYTGEERYVDTAGRIEKFRRKYGQQK
jgi:large subunit ribosomal protein L31